VAAAAVGLVVESAAESSSGNHHRERERHSRERHERRDARTAGRRRPGVDVAPEHGLHRQRDSAGGEHEARDGEGERPPGARLRRRHDASHEQRDEDDDAQDEVAGPNGHAKHHARRCSAPANEPARSA
jgi:hypothetical protein